MYVDNSISNSVGESSFLRLDADEKLNLDDQDYILLNSTLTSLKTIIEKPTKPYIDGLHDQQARRRRDLGSSFFDEEVDLVKNNRDKDLNASKLTNLDSIIVNRNPCSDNELANKKYFDGELDGNTILSFNQTLQNYLRVPVGNDIYTLTKYDKIQLTDVTEIRSPNTGTNLLQSVL